MGIIGSLCVISAILQGAAVVGDDQELKTPDLIAESECQQYEVRVYLVHDNVDCAPLMEVHITDKGAATTRKYPLDRLCEDVGEIFVSAERVVLLGTRRAGHFVVVIFPNREKMVGPVLCFWPSLNPDKQLVVFQGWYPRFCPPEIKVFSLHVLATDDPEGKSLDVFPPPSGYQKDPSEFDVRVSPVLWFRTGMKFLFFFSQGPPETWSRQKFFLAICSFDMSTRRVDTQVFPIDVTSYLKDQVHEEEPRFRIKTLNWVDDSTISFTLADLPYWKDGPFELKLSGFQQEPTLEKNR